MALGVNGVVPVKHTFAVRAGSLLQVSDGPVRHRIRTTSDNSEHQQIRSLTQRYAPDHGEQDGAAADEPSSSRPTRAPSSQIPSMHFSLSMDLLQPNPVLRSEAARLMTTVIWTARRDLEGESRREAVIYHYVNHCL